MLSKCCSSIKFCCVLPADDDDNQKHQSKLVRLCAHVSTFVYLDNKPDRAHTSHAYVCVP